MAEARQSLTYCVADRDFFETPARLPDDGNRYPLACGEVPAGWSRAARGLWTVLTPDGVRLPEQGWKIHVSATPRVAGVTLDRATAVLLRRRVPFKFLRSRDALLLMVDKHMARGSSGKFITVYPADETELEEVVAELRSAVDGLPGQHILSDLRIGPGPVHVRYGAFVERWCADEDGQQVPALRDPSGTLVPDVRSPVFAVPDWVTPPSFLDEPLAALRAAGFGDFPYRVVKALHFTNAGGIYLARHRVSGRTVVLREARPFAGLDGAAADGVERLHREYRALTALRGLDCVPEVLGLHTAWEHHFLAEEYVEGETLLDAVLNRYPAVGRDTGEEATRAYADWASAVIANLGRALDAVHERGLRFRDVHPLNVIVRPDDSVVLVDFEYATDLDASDGLRVGARGFAAPAGTAPSEVDDHGLWATWLFTLLPMTEMAEFAPDKAPLLEAVARERFGLSPTEGPRRPDAARSRPTAPTADAVHADDVFGPAEWPALRDRLAEGIHACATPDREDRLFPADWEVFRTGGHTLAHGAAGVLLALHRAGATVPDSYVDWLSAAARRVRPEAGGGLYDGLYGAAVVLDELGRPDEASEILARARSAGDTPRAGLFGGQAGIALTLCRFAVRTGEPALLDEAVRIAERLETLRREGSSPGLGLPSHAGLMYGLGGPALLQLRLHRVTGEERYLKAARAALEWDIRQCVPMADGTVQAKQGHRHLPYLDEGSIGIALVAREYLTHADDPALAAFVAAATPCGAAPFVREPGLFHGRAGLVAGFALLAPADENEELLAAVRNFSWHALRRGEGLYVPGAGLLRLSADLATGSAGVLLALHTVFEGKGDLGTLLPVS
ncbi:class III lanthionine synthetase LanKC [Streptomyces sp. NPDC101175]|uniref:class III lanthionine synthetase LanKC n=1 Tax=Streptomyces sp. NPDC101175 TaxID=3366123 RepID=UPI0038350A29